MLITLGLGGLSYLEWLRPYRPFFTGGAVAFISWTLWSAYRKKWAAAAKGRDTKQPADRLARGILWGTAAAVVFLAFLPYMQRTGICRAFFLAMGIDPALCDIEW